MTISDSELKSYSEGAGWNKGWSEGSSQGTSKSEGKQGGGSVDVKVLKSGGGVSGYYGYNTCWGYADNGLMHAYGIVTGKQIGRAHV